MTGTDRNYRAFLLPVFSANPYVRELSGALHRGGVEIVLPEDGQRLETATASALAGDVVHIQWIHPFFAKGTRLQVWRNARRFLASIVDLKRRGVAVVWTIHNLSDHDGRAARTQHRVGRRLALASDCVLVHSPTGEALARRHFGLPARVRFEVVRHGSYRGVYPDDGDDATARAAMGYTAGEVIFGLIGSLRAYKGVDRLIEHFRRLPDAHARLLLAGGCGGSANEQAIRSLCDGDDRIRFLPGFVEDERLHALHRACDAIVVPYRSGFTSGAIVLAQAFDRAVIAPAHGCFEDQVGDGGWVYDPADDRQQPAGVMREVLADPSEAIRRGRRAGRDDMEWTWDRMASNIRAVYDSVRRSSP